MANISSFRDLLVWQEGHKLVISIYQLTQNFPANEQFGLTNQLRRAKVSITSNIAEGFVRKNKKEKIQFYFMSLGSLAEVQNQILIALDVKYIKSQDYEKVFEQTETIGRLLNSLIKATNNRSF